MDELRFQTLMSWCHWKEREKNVSEDDLEMAKAIRDLASEVGTWKAKHGQAERRGFERGIEEAANRCDQISKREEYVARDKNIPANEFLSHHCALEIRAIAAKGEK
jgi:hypothetical protein